MSVSDKTWTRGQALHVAQELGLSGEEFEAIEIGIARTPNRFELAVFAGMWSEHCSYKTTRSRLRSMRRDGPGVLAGPGAHAGVVDVGEGWGLAFKIESHNHPSAVEPYQGAATGVGGILRDIIAQGARPVAVMDSLCFGSPHNARTHRLRSGVVAGIAGYGNAFGVANVGGRVRYDERYDGNPLVNALAAGLVRHDEMRSARAQGVGNPVIYVGAPTGRDGILGAAFASAKLDDDASEQRSHVQVGDPFSGKKLLEALLSFGAKDGLVACQDMGATGLTCAASEMAEAGGLGITLHLEHVSLRDSTMSPEEILVSESQERFLLVVERGREDAALTHFRSYGLEASVCGEVTAEDRFRALYDGRNVVDLPASLVAEGCPETNFEIARALPQPAPYTFFDPPPDAGETLRCLLANPSLSTKHAIYTRYDGTVGNRTVCGPGQAEAAVQMLPESTRGYALTITGRGDVCAADPYLGALAALGDACRDLACVGAQMVAVTDGLNMGSPTDPTENLRLSETIRGLADGLDQLEVPVTGGNVSLYNESPRGAIPPTPMIGAVGLLDDVRKVPSGRFHRGDRVLLVGELNDASRFGVYGELRAEGGCSAPSVDLAQDRALASFLVAAVDRGGVVAAKDAGAGGLAVALAKLALRGRLGVDIALSIQGRADWALFGEGSGTAWVIVEESESASILDLAKGFSTPVRDVGTVGGDRLTIRDFLDETLSDLAVAFGGVHVDDAEERLP